MSNARTLREFQTLFAGLGITARDVKLRWASGAVGDLSATLTLRLPGYALDLRCEPRDRDTGETVFAELLATARTRLLRGLVLTDLEARGGPPS